MDGSPNMIHYMDGFIQRFELLGHEWEGKPDHDKA